jgi:hypothetical protein
MNAVPMASPLAEHTPGTGPHTPTPLHALTRAWDRPDRTPAWLPWLALALLLQALGGVTLRRLLPTEVPPATPTLHWVEVTLPEPAAPPLPPPDILDTPEEVLPMAEAEPAEPAPPPEPPPPAEEPPPRPRPAPVRAPVVNLQADSFATSPVATGATFHVGDVATGGPPDTTGIDPGDTRPVHPDAARTPPPTPMDRAESPADVPPDPAPPARRRRRERERRPQQRPHPLLAAGVVRNPPASAYPPAARAARLETDCHLQLLISAAGVVEEVVAVQCLASGHGFEEVASRWALEHYRFEPALDDGEPVAARLRWTFRFRTEG